MSKAVTSSVGQTEGPGQGITPGQGPVLPPDGAAPVVSGAALRRSRSKRRSLVWLIRGLILVGLLGVWQWYGSTTGGVFVPSVTQTFGRFPELITSGVLAESLWSSNVALLVGYPISAIAGLGLGFLIGRKRTADRALSYWLDIAMVIPMVAIVPVVIVGLGLTLTARVAVVILFTLPVIILNSRAAVRIIDQQLVEMADSFGAARRQIWSSVIMPAALPLIFTGLSIGIGRAISGMIVVELILIPVGLGGLLLEFKSTFSGSDLYAVTLVVIAEGVVLTSLAHSLERKITQRMRGGK
ncbi:MAG TPA: ABC transporter permease subunit [Propionibacteriaceae bacterium]